MKFRIRRLFVLSAVTAVLAACGGGDEGASAGAPVFGESTASTWRMDAYTYTNGGFSEQVTTAVRGRTETTVVVSTATLIGTGQGNGAYSGSSLSLVFVGDTAGTYEVVPTRAEFLAAAAGARVIYVEATVGIAVNTGATMYVAAGGQVSVTRDADGRFHLTSTGSLPTTKSIDVQGGVDNAPPTMQLTINNAY